VLVAHAVAGVALAQVEQGAITGRVLDEGGGVVPGANVTVTQTGTGVARETVTNAAGQYAVPYLVVGSTKSRQGSADSAAVRVTGVAFASVSLPRWDLLLKPGPLQTEVTVTRTPFNWSCTRPRSATSCRDADDRATARRPESLPLVTLAPGVVDRGNTGTGPLINGARIELDVGAARRRRAAEQHDERSQLLAALESVQEFESSPTASRPSSAHGIQLLSLVSGSIKLKHILRLRLTSHDPCERTNTQL